MSRIDRWRQLLWYHKPSQLTRRATSVLKSKAAKCIGVPYRPRVSTVQLRSNATDLLACIRSRRAGLWRDRHEPYAISRLAAGEFTFLNETRGLVSRGVNADAGNPFANLDWNPDASRLWRFHLQYHESLLELADEVGFDHAWGLIESWLNESRHRSPHVDPDAWHPFCISMRLPNWLALAGTATVPANLATTFWKSVAEQVDWLWRHRETDLGGNHLLENLRTLAIADASLQGDLRINRAQLYRWIEQELEQQVLDSGEHVERTPTYHALMTLAVQEIADASEAVNVSCTARHRHTEMVVFLREILHPDGRIPLLGDSVFGETPHVVGLPQSVAGLAESSVTPGPSEVAATSATRQLADYWTWRSPDHQDFLIHDVGPVACDHLPAHAHADLLGLEASIGGERFLVDGGTYDYEDSDDRQRCRGTASHNTVMIDGRNQCDMWSRFRMGRRGHILHHSRGKTGKGRWSLTAHDAYQHLGIPSVLRAIIVDESDQNLPVWLILDWFRGTGHHELQSRLQFAPAFQVSHFEQNELGNAARVTGRTGIGRHVRPLQDQWDLRESSYSPDFGVRLPIQSLLGTTKATQSKLTGWMISENDLPWPMLELASDTLTVHFQAFPKDEGESDYVIRIPQMNQT